MRRMDEAEAALIGSQPDQITMGLMPALALVGASGMTQADREEWLHAAVDALRHIPWDLLSGAIARAKMNCDHPSKIVPFIVKDVASSLGFRRRRLADLQELDAEHRALPAPGASFCTADEAAEIIEKHCPWVREGGAAPVRIDRGPPRMPTREDYIALGVDPATLDKLAGERRAAA